MPESSRLKICIQCNKEYYSNSNSNSILCSDPCRKARRNEYLKDYYQDNKEVYLERSRKYNYKKPSYPLQSMLNSARRRAEKLNLPFNLELKHLKVPEYCPILGIKLEHSKGGVSDGSPSLDRVIPSIGYVLGNVQIISNKANIMKSNAYPDELLKFADWVYKNFKDN